MKQHKHKRAEYTEDSKSRHSKYALKHKQGSDMNHKRHTVPVNNCSLCYPE